MSNTKDFFLMVSQRLLSNWTALKMAVEHGMGSKDQAIDLSPYITEFLYLNENLSSDEIAAELEEYMDNEFQTELQDNSTIQIAEQLLKFYRYCIEGNETTAISEMEKLPVLQPWILSRDEIIRQNSRTVSTTNDNDDSESESENDGEQKMETPADDEWVEIKTRRRK